MRKNLFYKHLTLTLAIILVSFTVLGTLLVTFAGSIWMGEKRELMVQNAANVSLSMSNTFAFSDHLLSPDELDQAFAYQPHLSQSIIDMINNSIRLISYSIRADVFVINELGDTLYCSDAGLCVHMLSRLPEDVVHQALGGNAEGTSNLGEMYAVRQHYAFAPVVIDGRAVGAVFVTAPANGMMSQGMGIMRAFLFSASIAIVFTFLAVYVMTYRLVRPLRMMAHASHAMAQGDFTVRVPVSGKDEIGELAEAFNHMSDALTQMEHMRRSFIANVSHELKTPMTTISGFIDGILDGTVPPDKQETYLQVVSDEVKRLSRMVTAMLNLSRLEAGEVQLAQSEFDICALMAKTALLFERAIEDKQLDIRGLDALEPEVIGGDYDLLSQVIYNLVENAVKFTPNSGTISFCVVGEPEQVTVLIKNSGEGIPKAELPHIFERFYKTDKSRSKDKSGVGLGLYIVKTLVGLHGGTITARSLPGEYCEFCFTVPRNSGE